MHILYVIQLTQTYTPIIRNIKLPSDAVSS